MTTATRKPAAETTRSKLARLVALHAEGNAHALTAARDFLAATYSRYDRQQIRLAIAHMEGRHKAKVG